MPRDHLPRRRHALTEPITTVDGRTILATVGFDLDWRPRELFLAGAKEGSDMAFLLDDTSVIISIALQHGITARELSHSISPNRASVLGAALELIAHYEEHGPDVPRPATTLRVV
jgi:hypothetical protein